MEDRPVKLLYVMGFSRSGTTVFANALGSIDGFATLGELSSHLWERVGGEGHRCGCGAELRDCPFWRPVLTEALGGFPSEADARDFREAERRFLKTRYIGRHMRAKPGDARLDPGAVQYVDALARIYRAAALQAGARVVVDASKRPADAAALELAPGVEPYFVHLVRDSRAVAHSWQRPKRAGLTQFKPRQVAWRWMRVNAAALVVDRLARERSLLVRYEDFVRDPAQVLRSAAELVGESPERLPVLDSRRLDLKTNHLVAGNPRHSGAGVVELREDDEWVRAMPRSKRLLVTSLCSPFLRAFRYAWRPTAPVSRG
jgi:hypothetical protein